MCCRHTVVSSIISAQPSPGKWRRKSLIVVMHFILFFFIFNILQFGVFPFEGWTVAAPPCGQNLTVSARLTPEPLPVRLSPQTQKTGDPQPAGEEWSGALARLWLGSAERPQLSMPLSSPLLGALSRPGFSSSLWNIGKRAPEGSPAGHKAQVWPSTELRVSLGRHGERTGPAGGGEERGSSAGAQTSLQSQVQQNQ